MSQKANLQKQIDDLCAELDITEPRYTNNMTIKELEKIVDDLEGRLSDPPEPKFEIEEIQANGQTLEVTPDEALVEVEALKCFEFVDHEGRTCQLSPDKKKAGEMLAEKAAKAQSAGLVKIVS